VLVQLEAHGFRNLEPLRLTLGSGSHLVLGANGAGKTSVLEAIYLLATTRSFRTSQLADCCRHGADRFHLRAEVEAAGRVRLDFDWQQGKSLRSLNGRRTPLAEHLAALPVIAWTAADAEILTGPPAERRRFLDRGIVSQRPAAISVITRYRQALQEKRRLLLGPAVELDAWNQVLAAAAAELILLRAEYAEELTGALERVLAECDLGLPPISLHYRCSPDCADAAVIYEKLAAVAARERLLQQPVLGPHRDELRIRWQGQELRRVASAGERKVLGLALLAAHGLVTARGNPIYLLDDADTELDPRRLQDLWRVFGNAGQILVTSNRPRVWEPLDITHRWHCETGTLVPTEAVIG
jgi:DNA replication and repair protein RecF